MTFPESQNNIDHILSSKADIYITTMVSLSIHSSSSRVERLDERSSTLAVATGALLTYLGSYHNISQYLLAGFLALGGMTALLVPLCRDYPDITRMAQLVLGVAMGLLLLKGGGEYDKTLNVHLILLWIALPNVVYHGMKRGLDKEDTLLRLATVSGLFYWTIGLTGGSLKPEF